MACWNIARNRFCHVTISYFKTLFTIYPGGATHTHYFLTQLGNGVHQAPFCLSGDQSKQSKSIINPDIQPIRSVWPGVLLLLVGVHGCVHVVVCIPTSGKYFVPLPHFPWWYTIGPGYQANVIPQLTVTIKQDLHMTPTQIANSNIVALLATWVLLALDTVFTNVWLTSADCLYDL